MRVIQCLHSYNACDLYTIISRSCTRTDLYGLRIYAIMLPSGGFAVAHYSHCSGYSLMCTDTHVNINMADCFTFFVEIAWRSGSVMDCHVTTRGSIPGGHGVFTQIHVCKQTNLLFFACCKK